MPSSVVCRVSATAAPLNPTPMIRPSLAGQAGPALARCFQMTVVLQVFIVEHIVNGNEWVWLGNDAETDPSPYLDAILELSPGYVAALSREADARALSQELVPEDEADNSHDWINDITIDIDHALMQLPQRDLNHARAVYSDMAVSHTDEDREKAARIVPAIVPFDHDFGLQLWGRLLSDRSKKVRLQAVELLHLDFDMTGTDDNREQHAEDGVRRLGITWRDAFHLMRSYAEGEQGIAPQEIGRIVLDQLLKAEDERSMSS
jgi:hypothetical protein